MRERGILRDWVEAVLTHPDRQARATDGTAHFLKRVPEYGGRWLRVVLNDAVDPPLVVTVFFDRRVR
jgi:hypothetical protein